MSFLFCPYEGMRSRQSNEKERGEEMAGEKKETPQRDENGVRKQSYKRFKPGRDYQETESDEMIALCDMMELGIFKPEEIDTETGERVRSKGGRPRKYETVEELQDGIRNYIEYIRTQAAAGVHLIPDVEGLALFLGVARSTLFEWQKSRPGEFSDTIKSAFTAIAAVKKQLALMGKIPPIVFATDFNNNHGYTQAAQKIDLNVGKQAAELPEKADIIRRLPINEIEKDPADSDDLEEML